MQRIYTGTFAPDCQRSLKTGHLSRFAAMDRNRPHTAAARQGRKLRAEHDAGNEVATDCQIIQLTYRVRIRLLDCRASLVRICRCVAEAQHASFLLILNSNALDRLFLAVLARLESRDVCADASGPGCMPDDR